MHEMIKKWADFSVSETKPLSWMLLGPFLMILTLILAPSSLFSPYLPLVAAGGLLLSWHYRLGGFALALMGFVFYFTLSYFFGHSDLLFWKMGWGISLALGLTIAFLSMEELKSFYTKLKEKKEKALSDLQISLHSFEEKTATEKRTLENEVDTLKEELFSSREEVETLLSLVDASRIESDKVHKQNQDLATKALEKHREMESLKIEFVSRSEKLSKLDQEQRELSKVASQRLKEINTLRVEFHQSKLLIEEYQNKLQRAREYFLSQKKPVPPPQKENPEALILKTLEKDKGIIKKAYDQTLADYQKLKNAFDKAPNEESLSSELKEKKKRLEETKAELVGIEREIFITKKGLQERGAAVH